MLALDIIELRYPTGVVVTTSGITKFFSNGLDLNHLASTPGFITQTFYPIEKRLSTYPMPTIALINGHGFAGGLILAMHHDYRFMNPSKGYLCMNEVDFGMLVESSFLAIFKEKLGGAVFRDVFLEGHRFPAQEALKAGMVDELGGLDEVLNYIKARNLVKKGESGVYGKMKEDMYRGVVSFTEQHQANQRWRRVVDSEREEEKGFALRRVQEWEQGSGKSKL